MVGIMYFLTLVADGIDSKDRIHKVVPYHVQSVHPLEHLYACHVANLKRILEHEF
jgi:hypothetical protein